MTTPLSDVEDRIGYAFSSPSLLHRALTHSSAVNQRDTHLQSNERLEFLGDRVLGLAVAELLHERFPTEAEGALAKRHAALVCKDALARIGGNLDLAGSLIMSKSEEETGGRENAGLIADACEAVIAALYLDAGFPTARAFVWKHWEPLLAEDRRPPQDPKTELQEWAQAHGLPLPEYVEVDRSGPAHAPRFRVRVDVSGLHSVTAEGSSKRAAAREAAKRILDQTRNGKHA